ncbi:MAG TPA: hypothetical protein VMX97_10710 [Hyphomicrobiaceae bacterium]|nr:hypothetical protein [Hyphomicrobiaceae bacterium]
MKAQAAAEEQKAAIEAQWSERRSLEEKGAAQRQSQEELRKAKLAQSRLTAVAGGSGAGADDETVMKLWGGIEKEGRYNAANVTAAGDQRAAGIDYQSGLNTWVADSNARIKRAGAKSTLIGGFLGAAGQAFGGMSSRYSSGSGSTGRTGYA